MAFESDWELLRQAAPVLQQYVLSKDLYWPLRLTAHLPGSVQTPQLTPGNLALSQARLSALDLPGQQAEELARLASQIQAVREEWRSNWARKATQEFTSRLKLWNEDLRELRADPAAQSRFYANEVRHRAILSLLRVELLDPVPQNQAEQLAMLDQILRGISHPGPFVWEPEVRSRFPQDEYWFLYLTFG